MKSIKKPLAVILSLVLAITLLVTPMSFSAAALSPVEDENVLFADDFGYYPALSTANKTTAFELQGWYTSGGTKTSYITTGAYVVPDGSEVYMNTQNRNGSDKWSEYSVEGDIEYLSVPEERTSNSYAMLVANTTSVIGGGYEFGINYNQTGSKYALLRRRKLTVDDVDVYSGVSLKQVSVSDKDTYHLKLTYKNGFLFGYVDGALVISYDTSDNDVMLTSGYAGFRKNGKNCEISLDNFKVTKVDIAAYFSDDFSYADEDEMAAAGWTTRTANLSPFDLISGGALDAQGNGNASWQIMTTGAAGVETWTDYSVEAEVTLGTGGVTSGSSSVGLTGRVNGTYGYEYSFVVNTSNKATVRLRRIAAGNTVLANDANNGSTSAVTIATITAPTTYKLKMVMCGSTIKCYVNDVLKWQSTDTTYTKGAAGIKAIGATAGMAVAAVDNFKVKKADEFFAQDFANNTTSLIGYTATGKTTIGDSDASSAYIADGKFTNQSGGSKDSGLYYTLFSSHCYTVEAKATIDAAPAGTGNATCGITAGESTTAHKTGFHFYVGLNGAGAVQAVTLQSLADKTQIDTRSIGTTIARIPAGTELTYKLTISYDADTDKTTAKGTLEAKDVAATISSTDFEAGSIVYAQLELELDGDISGYSAMYVGRNCNASFSTFKAYDDECALRTAGEIDGDDVVTLADGRYVFNAVLGIEGYSVADANFDSVTDIRDLVYFKKVIGYYFAN